MGLFTINSSAYIEAGNPPCEIDFQATNMGQGENDRKGKYTMFQELPGYSGNVQISYEPGTPTSVFRVQAFIEENLVGDTLYIGQPIADGNIPSYVVDNHPNMDLYVKSNLGNAFLLSAFTEDIIVSNGEVSSSAQADPTGIMLFVKSSTAPQTLKVVVTTLNPSSGFNIKYITCPT